MLAGKNGSERENRALGVTSILVRKLMDSSFTSRDPTVPKIESGYCRCFFALLPTVAFSLAQLGYIGGRNHHRSFTSEEFMTLFFGSSHGPQSVEAAPDRPGVYKCWALRCKCGALGSKFQIEQQSIHVRSVLESPTRSEEARWVSAMVVPACICYVLH